MHSLVTEESPEFENLDEYVNSYKHRVNYDLLALDIRAMMNKGTRGEKAYLTLEYPYSQISNVVAALRRRDLDHGSDFRITRGVGEDRFDEDGEPVQAITISAF